MMLTLALLFVAVGGAKIYAFKSFGDAITSLDYITGGGKFVISDNGTKAKYFITNNENQNADVANVPSDAYFYFTLEKYNGGDIPNSTEPADNIYKIKITNAAGTKYATGGGYLNAVLTYADVVISGPEAGWSNVGNEIKDALWYVTYDAEKGFSFQNVYRSENSSKSWLPISNNFVADQQYLKLYKSIEVNPVDENVEITVDAETRNYQLYVPGNAQNNCPLVISLHGANGASTNYTPFGKSVADVEGCIVAYPQGKVTNFPIGFDGDATGWTSSGEDNFDVDFIKAVIEDVASKYQIDRKRIYCCGFSNGGMMTYALSNTCSDIFAAFASISGYPINEFHLRHAGARPVPFLHIHGKADNFVLYSKMPTIVDEMVARLGANPVPTTTTVDGKYTKNVYQAGDGSFPYVYYEVDGMGHEAYTENTEDGNSAQTMWNFFEQYTLDSSCDPTLKWAPRIEEAGFTPASHGWTMNDGTTLLQYGGDQYTVDNKNVYHSLQFDNGNYLLSFNSTGAAVSMGVKIQKLTSPNTIVLNEIVKVGDDVVLPFEITDGWGEYQLTITRLFASNPITISNVVIKESNVPGKAEVKTPLLLLKNGEINTTDFDVTPIASSTLTTDNLYAATFTSTNGTPCNTFQYKNLDVSKYDKAVIKFGEPIADADAWQINLPDGSFTALPKGITEYEVDLSGVNSYGDFTIFSWFHTGKSISIVKVYLYTDKYVIQNQQQTVTVNNLGSALSLSSVVSGSTLVSLASSDGNILYGKAIDGSEWGSNQIKSLALDDAMALIEGDDNTSYQFRIIDATDEITTLPTGITNIYRIKAFKKDGTTPFIGPSWNGENSFYLQEISWTYNVADGTGTGDASFFAITEVAGKENTYKISAYKKDGTAGYKEAIYNKSEWTFCVVSQTQQQQNVDVWVELPTLSFNDNGSASTGYESLTTTGGLSFNSLTGVLTTNGKEGKLTLEFAAPMDLKYLNKYTVNRSGNDAIIDRVRFYDADDNLINTWNNSKLQNDGLDNNATNAFINHNPVKKLVWESDAGKSTGLTLTITGITWQQKTMSCVNAGETVLNTLPWNKMDGSGTATPDWNMHTQTDTYYGNYSGDATHYVDLTSYSELRVYRDNNDPCRAFFINSAGKGTNQVNTGSATWNAEKKYWSFDLSGVEKWGGKVALKCIKANAGVSSLTVNNIVVYATPSANAPKYVLAGSGFQLAETVAALADATATSIDATGVTGITTNSEAGRTLLTSANPNCLFLGTTGNGGLANTQNVITSGDCAQLAISDGYPFCSPIDFTATAVPTYGRSFTSSTTTTVCLPFALTETEAETLGTFYELSSFDGGTIHLSPVAEPEANKAYLVVPTATSLTLSEPGKAIAATPADLGAEITSVEFIGTLASTSIPASDGTNSYFAFNNGSLVKIATKAATLPAFRGYFKVSTSAIGARSLNISFDEETTGVKTIDSKSFGVSKYFDLQGRRVENPTKGLYIVNGKKVVK